MCLAGPSYLVNARLSAGKGEGEAQRQLGPLEAHIVQEVGDALHDVVKELQERAVLMQGASGWGWQPTPRP